MGAVSLGAYLRVIRSEATRDRGATDDEVARAMPGDNVVKHPRLTPPAPSLSARPEEIGPG